MALSTDSSLYVAIRTHLRGTTLLSARIHATGRIRKPPLRCCCPYWRVAAASVMLLSTHQSTESSRTRHEPYSTNGADNEQTCSQLAPCSATYDDCSRTAALEHARSARVVAHCSAAQAWHVQKLCRSAGFRHAEQTCDPDDHDAPEHASSYSPSAVALAADQRSSRRRCSRRGDSDEKGVDRRHRRRRTSQSKKPFLDRTRAILAL